MKRKGSRNGAKFCDILLFVVILGLVLLNVFITMTYFYREGRRHDTSRPATSGDDDSSGKDSATKDGPAPQASSHEPESPLDLVKDDERIPTPAKYNYSHHAWPFADMDSMIPKFVSHKYWGPNVTIDKATGTLDFEGFIQQASVDAAFAAKHSNNGAENPQGAYQRHLLQVKQSGCDVLTVPFQPKADAKCIEYLTNFSNWKVFRPLAMGFDQRTIKFEVDFEPIQLPDGTNFSMLGSILKVPQRLFPNEAFSEVASYHADRVLRVNRIPPTGWVCIPESKIRAAVAEFGATVETVDEFLEESKVHNYTEWIEKDLFQFVEQSKWMRTVAGTDERCIGASIQLKVADVAHLLDSVLKIPYVPHNESWFRYFNIAEQHDDANRPIFYGERFTPSLLHISELNTFDFVIGNGDRSPNKNNFVVGGCVRRHECGNQNHDLLYLRHPNFPTYVHLDQGMGFYGNPRRNPIAESISKHKKETQSEDTFCLFRTPLINRLTQLHATVEGEGRDAVSLFEKLMEERLPEGVRVFVTSHSLQLCHDRMTKLLHLVERCLEMSNKHMRKFVLTP